VQKRLTRSSKVHLRDAGRGIGIVPLHTIAGGGFELR